MCAFLMIRMTEAREKYDVKFLNDTKRVIQSILTKKITTNSLAGSYASLEAILENSGCGIYVADMSKSEILYMNNYCKQLLSNIIEQNKLENIFFPYCREPELYRGLRDGGGQVV